MDTIKKNIILTPFNILYKFSPKFNLELLFRLKQGYKLNLDNPITYNEKLQWIKLYDKNPLMPKCVDKFTVRDYVKEKGCAEILNELLWEGFNPEDIPFKDFPNKFVIKVTHGSTFNIICTDKNKLDIEKTKKKLKRWLKEKFLPCYGEWFYGIEKPRIIVEKFIESEDGLKDYKVFCFNGIPQYISVYSDRSMGQLKQEIYDIHWEEVNGKTGNYGNVDIKTKKPEVLQDLLNYATKLSKDFKHARVDFFIEQNKIYFGEITFTSGAGLHKFSSYDFDKTFGIKLKLG